MKQLPLMPLFLTRFFVSTNALSEIKVIDFEGIIEEFDVGSHGMPTRIETQGYTFYSSGGILFGGGSDNAIAWCPGVGCTITFYGHESDLLRVISFDVASAPVFPGSGTIRVEGNFWDDPDRLDPSVSTLPFSSSWTTHSFDEDWQYPHALEWFEFTIATNSGGPVILDNIVVETGSRSVGIDVLPNDEANVVYPNRSGNLPVAILSAPDFDATQVSVNSLKINGLPWSPTSGAIADLVGVQNVDGEHGPDLVVTFPVQESGIFCNDTDVAITGNVYGSEYYSEYISGSGDIDASDCEEGLCHAY